MNTSTGLVVKIRRYEGLDDVGPAAEITNSEFKADGVPNFESEEEMRAWVRNPSDSFTASRDVDFAEVDGHLVGIAQRQWVDTTDGLREYRVNGAVHADWRRQGIGTALYEANLKGVRDLAATHATDRPKVLGSWSNDRQAGRIALLREQG